MNDTRATFNRLGHRVKGLADRMLGFTAKAEEVLQDAWLRWQKAAPSALDRAQAGLP